MVVIEQASDGTWRVIAADGTVVAEGLAQALRLHENLKAKRRMGLRALSENQVQRVNRRHNERYQADQP
jgi:hypothetical protein